MVKDTKISPVSLEQFDDELLQLSEQQQAELSGLYQTFAEKFQVGKVVSGKVIGKDHDGVLVSIEYKSDGLIPLYEFSEHELKKVQINDQLDVLLDRLEDENGMVVLSYQKAKALKAWEKIVDYAAKDEAVRGFVTHKVKGGLSVDIGIPAFLPGSQIDTQRVTDFDHFIGQEVVGKILKVNKKRGNVIISRRKYLEEQRAEDKKKALENIAEGAVLQGVVKNITSYGVFVDIGGIDGLLHIIDMSWGRIGHPSELVKIGDVITVKVISFDKANEKISLGLKQLESNPWEKVNEKYPVASKVKGRISSITDYGLFVEVEKGVEGLIHISEVSWTERISHLSKHFNVGDEVEALVVALDKDNRRMSLSVKKLKDDPWKTVAEKFKIGDKISGKITNITDFGLFVQIIEGVDGLVHISDISWTDHVSHPGDRYKKGDTTEAVILSLDPEHRKISLGIKQLEKDPWTRVAEAHKVGDIVEGTVSKITNFGAFIRLASNIEGLVHVSELTDKENIKVEDILKVGQTEKFKVIKVSPEERKLGLSLRAITQPDRPITEYTRPEYTRTEGGEGSAPEETRRPRFRENREGGRGEGRESRPYSKSPHKERGSRESSEASSYTTTSSSDNAPKNALQKALEQHAAKMKTQSDDIPSDTTAKAPEQHTAKKKVKNDDVKSEETKGE